MAEAGEEKGEGAHLKLEEPRDSGGKGGREKGVREQQQEPETSSRNKLGRRSQLQPDPKPAIPSELPPRPNSASCSRGPLPPPPQGLETSLGKLGLFKTRTKRFPGCCTASRKAPPALRIVSGFSVNLFTVSGWPENGTPRPLSSMKASSPPSLPVGIPRAAAEPVRPMEAGAAEGAGCETGRRGGGMKALGRRRGACKRRSARRPPSGLL